MLKQLYIKNFTLIDELDIAFSDGFSVITGETGAGKSIILGALSLILGQRADSKSIKNGCERCIVEAHFDLSKYHIEPLFAENDIDFDAADTIFRREITAAGKSRAFINDTPVPLTVMKNIGGQLVDIHSQHQNLLLQEDDFQLHVTDIIAQNDDALTDYRQAFGDYCEAKRALEQLEKDIEKAHENEEFMRFQYEELQQAKLESGLLQSLEQESETLSHVEDIKSALYEASELLSGDEAGIVERLKSASRAVVGIREVYAESAETADRLESSFIEIDDIAGEVNRLLEHVDFDPKRLEEVNEQLDAINALLKKHHAETDDELIALRDELGRQLDTIGNGDEALATLREKVEAAKTVVAAKAATLTKRRSKAATVIEQEMQSRLAPLGIPNVRFAVELQPLNTPGEDGADRVAFLFSANKGTPLQPVSQVASGGEIARVMLSLKAMISGAVQLPTIIFDEIDTGVSGRVAEMMAKMMRDMGENNRQVISITHLPQIAALGKHHYKVYKEDSAGGTMSRMELLNDEQRIREIAQMLSGSDITAAAVENAKALLKN